VVGRNFHTNIFDSPLWGICWHVLCKGKYQGQ
jgi:hypothetical protein